MRNELSWGQFSLYPVHTWLHGQVHGPRALSPRFAVAACAPCAPYAHAATAKRGESGTTCPSEKEACVHENGMEEEGKVKMPVRDAAHRFCLDQHPTITCLQRCTVLVTIAITRPTADQLDFSSQTFIHFVARY